MNSVTSVNSFVNEQIAFHERMANVHAKVPARSAKHNQTAQQLRQLLEYIRSLEAKIKEQKSEVSSVAPLQLSLSFDELEDLPDELLQELSVSEGDRTDFQILKIVQGLGGIASLDRILVGIYRDTKEIMKRTTLTSRVYRMTQKGLLFPVPSRKGVYATRELTDDELGELLKSN